MKIEVSWGKEIKILAFLKDFYLGVTTLVCPPAAAIASMVAKKVKDSYDKEYERGLKNGHKAGENKGYARAKQEFLEIIRTYSQQVDFMLGALALGYVIARADGEASETEIDEIQYLVGTIKQSAWSPAIKNTAESIRKKCYRFSDAKLYLDDVPTYQLSVLDELARHIIQADTIGKSAEQAVYNEWKQYLKSR